MISKKEKKKRQHIKELKSFRKKLVTNSIWFDSLSKEKQFDILFMWKKLKKNNKLEVPTWTTITKFVPIDPTRPWGRKKPTKGKVLKYPPSLKYFILECRINPRYQPNKSKVRETAIETILNNN